MTLRELAVAAHRAREQEQAENEAAYRANRAEQACELAHKLLGMEIQVDPDPATGTAFSDGVEFRINWSEGIRWLSAKVTPEGEFDGVHDLEDVGKLIMREAARRQAPPEPPAPPQRDPLDSIESLIENGHNESAIARSLLSIARSLASLERHGIVTTPITELI